MYPYGDFEIFPFFTAFFNKRKINTITKNWCIKIFKKSTFMHNDMWKIFNIICVWIHMKVLKSFHTSLHFLFSPIFSDLKMNYFIRLNSITCVDFFSFLFDWINLCDRKTMFLILYATSLIRHNYSILFLFYDWNLLDYFFSFCLCIREYSFFFPLFFYYIMGSYFNRLLWFYFPHFRLKYFVMTKIFTFYICIMS